MNLYNILSNKKCACVFISSQDKISEISQEYIEGIQGGRLCIESYNIKEIKVNLEDMFSDASKKYSSVIFHDVDQGGVIDGEIIEKILIKFDTKSLILINKDQLSSSMLMLKSVELRFKKIVTYGHSLSSDYRVMSILKKHHAYEAIVGNGNSEKFSFEVKYKNSVLLTLGVAVLNRLESCENSLKINPKNIRSSAYISKHKKFKIERDFFDILFVGDTSFGENYQVKIKKNGGDNILEKNGYDYSLKEMRALMVESDFVVCNLETPITDIKESPYSKIKDYIHWTDINKAPTTLINHNVGLISLANNHTFDFSIDGFSQTLAVLEKNDLPFIGAGNNISESAKPFVMEVEYNNNIYRIAIISAFEKLKNYDEKYNVYASIKQPGLMPLDAKLISKTIKELKNKHPSIFVIIFPHWGGNYKFRDKYQLASANALINSGADLIIGHGSHMMQEFEKIKGKWVLFSIGNFMFNSRGRYKKLGVPPYSAVAKLMLSPSPENNSLDFNLKLYPIITDNLITNYQPRFLTESEFNDFCSIMFSKKISEETCIDGLPRSKDNFGYHFDLKIENKVEKSCISSVKYIGFICRVTRVKDLKDCVFLWMHRAMVIDKELVKHGYKVLCYTPIDINIDDETVRGYIYENGQFKSRVITIPKVNYDWHIGPVRRKNKKGLHYQEYEKWAVEHSRAIYPNRSFRLFTQDKLATYNAIIKLDKSLMPYTESFQANEEQLKRFLDITDRVFIKPQRGRMGDDIIIVCQNNKKFHIKYYLDKKIDLNVFKNLSKAVKFIREKSSHSSYIIQSSIDCIKFFDSIFDLRVVLLNDGTSWNLITEIRVGMKGSDLSNVSQGGINCEPKDILLQCLSEKKVEKLMDKIHLESSRVADYISKKFNDDVNEFTIDFMVDENINVFIAELNVKPGLSGMPELFEDFFNMKEKETSVYEKYTLPHGKLLAKFLVSMAEKKIPIKRKNTMQYAVEIGSNCWFDRASSPLDIKEEDYVSITSSFFNALVVRDESYSMVKNLYPSDHQVRIVFLSLTFDKQPIYIYKAGAAGLASVFDDLLKKVLRAHKDTSQLIAIKIDLVQEITAENNFKAKENIEFKRGIEGLAFEEITDIAFLPEQVIVNNIVNKNGVVQFGKIKNALNFYPGYLEKVQKGQLSKVYKFCTLSAFGGCQGNFLLFRGHKLFNKINKPLLIRSVCQATSYLNHCLKSDGHFIYEYLPKKDKVTGRYNILRHAGTIYAMCEVFEVLRQKVLLGKIKLSIEQLINYARPMEIKGHKTSCIVENGFIKLGANALTILAISKYCSLTDDKTYLPIAQQCAKWIEQTQDRSGKFSIHKQNYQSQEVENFISEYYPGEAIFALAKLYQIDHNKNWLKVAVKAANFIINVRDKGLRVDQLIHDHWLLYGLNECQAHQSNKKFVKHTWKICQAIMQAQSKSTNPADKYGSFYKDLRSTPVAVRAEGLCAAYHCLINNGMSEEAIDVLKSIQGCVRFQLQVQFQLPLAMYFPNPEKVIGGFHKSLGNYSIRIDYVQHNISALIGLWRILSH